MNINDSILKKSEMNVLALRALYASHGYVNYRMSKFEEYDIYAENKNFLVSDNVITFTDTDGKLMALRPDVTLSIIKNIKDEPEVTKKLCYNENVYRVDESSRTFRESMQSGLECIGNITDEGIADVLLLAAESLSLFSDEWKLVISDISLAEGIIASSAIPAEDKPALYKAIGEKNLHGIKEICGKAGDAGTYGKFEKLLSFSSSASELPEGLSSVLDRVMRSVKKSGLSDRIEVDFSVSADTNYYNGIVMKGFIKGIPDEVLSGGMYDNLMKSMGRMSHAIGFAVYTDRLERFDKEEAAAGYDGYVNIALPKGRLGEKVYEAFAKAGFECPAVLENSRKLIFENPVKKVRYFWVKPSDVAIYVERGAADIGVAGKDILLEHKPDVYELLDLGTGKCRMAVAGPKGFTDNKEGTLKVATKFVNIAKDYYASVGRDIDIIQLNGSIEIAPILGLSDVIVDIVETGTTLRENNLEVLETIVPISARLIANKSSYKFMSDVIERISEGLKPAEGSDND